jgi:beta-phosphoglucomutase-like phosphatase (HAD superfamily)
VFSATLFDYNGVLVDDELVHFEAFRDVLAPLGIELSQVEYWQRYLGFDDAGVFRTALAEAKLPADETRIAELVLRKKPRYLERAQGKLRGFPGAAELLKARAEVGPVVIVSGALRDEIELGLQVLGIREYVVSIVAAEDAPRSKPDPQGYVLGLRALEQAGVVDPSRNAVVFEDSLDGVKSALAAGLRCVGIAHSYPAQELTVAGAHCVVERIAEISPLVLDQCWRAPSA